MRSHGTLSPEEKNRMNHEASARERGQPISPPAVGGEALIQAVTDELLAHGEFSSAGNNRLNAEIAAKAVIDIVLAAQPASSLRPTEEQINAALNAWFKSPPSETDQGLERSMKAALIAADALRPPTSPLRGREDKDGADDLEHLDGMLDERSRES